jgi:hypothetical protein
MRNDRNDRYVLLFLPLLLSSTYELFNGRIFIDPGIMTTQRTQEHKFRGLERRLPSLGTSSGTRSLRMAVSLSFFDTWLVGKKVEGSLLILSGRLALCMLHGNSG